MAPVQRIRTTVLIAGAEIPFITQVSAAASMEAQISTCTITTTERPKGAEIGDDVQIYASNGSETALVFRGELWGHTWETGPGTTVAIECFGQLKRVSKKWGGVDREYLNQDDAAVIRNLLEAWGIPSSRARIESSGWTLATILTLLAKKDSSFLQLINEIDQVAGYRTYDALNGGIYRTRYGALPGAATGYLQHGVDGTKISSSRQPDSIRNHWKVTGMTYQGVPVEAESSAVNVTLNAQVPPELRPFYAGDTLSSELIETTPKAQSTAERLVTDFNKTTQYFDVALVGTGQFALNDSVQLEYPPLEAGSGIAVVVQGIRHELTANSWLTNLKTDGGDLATPGA